MRLHYIIFILTLILVSCKGGNTADADMSKEPVVTVRDQTLYKAELYNAIPRNLPSEDSTVAAQTYIKMWINDRLMYDKAKQNIVNEKELGQLVEDYRKSLISNLYQEQLIRERFSKSVSDKELQAYYEQNKDKLKLKENIIKGLYLKVPVDSKELANFQKWYKQTSDAAIENIEKNRLQNAVNYEYFYDKWVSLNSMTENMPLSIGSGSQFLQSNRNVEVKDSLFVYLLNIKEYKLEGTEAPYEYIKNQLTEIYLEHKRAEYLKQVQEDLYNRAVSDKEIKFYDK